MSDRPLTLIFIASAILVALWLRRARPVSPAQASEEGRKRGIKVEITQPMTRDTLEQLMRGN